MSDMDCRHCKGWKGCVGKDFYNYSEIRWCLQQVYWLIEHKETLESGIWPTPDERDENIGTRRFKPDASFVNPELIVAELNERLAETGTCGRLLVTLVYAHVGINTLDGDARAALFYIAGWNRKSMSFNKWRWQRQQRKNEDKIASKGT